MQDKPVKDSDDRFKATATGRREKRLAKALRDNLRRRKAAAGLRKPQDAGGSEGPEKPP